MSLSPLNCIERYGQRKVCVQYSVCVLCVYRCVRVYTCDIDELASTVIAFVNQIKLICANAPSRVLLFTILVKVAAKGREEAEEPA